MFGKVKLPARSIFFSSIARRVFVATIRAVSEPKEEVVRARVSTRFKRALVRYSEIVDRPVSDVLREAVEEYITSRGLEQEVPMDELERAVMALEARRKRKG